LGLVGLSISFLAVLAWIVPAWAVHYVETHSEQVDQKLDWAVETPSEQLDQKIKRTLSTTYDYTISEADPGISAPDGVPTEEHPCEDYYDEDLVLPDDRLTGPGISPSDPYKCFVANLPASDADGATLATITEAAVDSYGGRNGSVAFSTGGVGYCFASKQDALYFSGDGLNGRELKWARMLGRIDKCYIAVF
jgi:hypothetical protein